MLDNILNLVKSTVSSTISQNNVVPADKKEQTVETTTQALGKGLQQNLSLSNLSNLKSLFGGGGTAATTSNPIVSNITNTVVSELVQKVGLSQGIANSIATMVVPTVMNVISGKIKDPNEQGFNLESVIGAFSGNNNGNSNSERAGSILGELGKVFK